MALIGCKIDKDANGRTTVTYSVQRIDPGDELNLISDTTNAALKWNSGVPLAAARAGEVYPLPHVNAAAKPFKVTEPMSLSSAVAECGEQGDDNVFKPWAGDGFPTIGSKEQ
jgi:hypothetical protein